MTNYTLPVHARERERERERGGGGGEGGREGGRKRERLSNIHCILTPKPAL